MTEMTLMDVLNEAGQMQRRAVADGHISIPLHEFIDYVLTPLQKLMQNEHYRQLAEIQRHGT
jgi:hypothetical protein